MTLGRITLSSAHALHSLDVSACAVGRDDLLYAASVCGPDLAVKSFVAHLHQPDIRCTLDCSDAVRAADNRLMRRLTRVDGGYIVHRHKLAYKTVQAVVLAKVDGLLPDCSTTSLWAKLRSPTFTTPVLPGWVDYIADCLRATGKLIDLRCWQCQCGLLLADTDDIDHIVSAGLRIGALSI